MYQSIRNISPNTANTSLVFSIALACNNQKLLPKNSWGRPLADSSGNNAAADGKGVRCMSGASCF